MTARHNCWMALGQRQYPVGQYGHQARHSTNGSQQDDVGTSPSCQPHGPPQPVATSRPANTGLSAELRHI